MRIEIRPEKVSEQIRSKESHLNKASDELLRRKDLIYLFLNSSLDSEGYVALKNRMEIYPTLIAGIEYAAILNKKADQKVTDELQSFFGLDAVSEQEYLDLQREALERVASLEEQYLSFVTDQYGMASGAMSGTDLFHSVSIYNAQHQADAAGEMLSRIYSYCEATSDVHADIVDDIHIAIEKGLQALADTPYDGDGWPTIDESWIADLRAATNAARPKIADSSDIYDGEIFNEDGVRGVFELPYELWSENEKKAMTEVLEILVQKTMDSEDGTCSELEKLITCGYEIDNFAKKNYRDSSKTGLALNERGNILPGYKVKTTFTMYNGFTLFLNEYANTQGSLFAQNPEKVNDAQRRAACLATGLLANAYSYSLFDLSKNDTNAIPPNMTIDLSEFATTASGETAEYCEVRFGNLVTSERSDERVPGSSFTFIPPSKKAGETATDLAIVFNVKNIIDPNGAKGKASLEALAQAGIDLAIGKVPGLSELSTMASILIDPDKAGKEAKGEAEEINKNSEISSEASLAGDYADWHYVDNAGIIAHNDGSVELIMIYREKDSQKDYDKSLNDYEKYINKHNDPGEALSFEQWRSEQGEV